MAAQRLMEMEVGGVSGAVYGEKSAQRLVQRSGDRDRESGEAGRKRSRRSFPRRGADTYEPRIPKLRKRSRFPGFLEPFWTEVLGRPARRGVTLVISDAHKRLKAAISKILCATRQRCRVHLRRNDLAMRTRAVGAVAGKSIPWIDFRPLSLSAFMVTAFVQGEADQRL